MSRIKTTRELILLCMLIGCTLAVSFSFAQVPDEEGLRRRRQRTSRKNVAQRIMGMPITLVKLPFELTFEGIGRVVSFAEDIHLSSRVKSFLVSKDKLVIMYPTADFGERDGFTGEWTFSHRRFLKMGNRLKAHVSYSTRAHQDHYVRYQAYNLIGPSYMDVQGRYHVNTNEDFYQDFDGDGKDDRTNFRHEQIGGDLTIGAKWRKSLHTQVFIDFTDHTIEDGDGAAGGRRIPSTLEKFEGDLEVAGLEGAALIGVGGRIVFDARDNNYYPSKGLFAAASATAFHQTDGSQYGFTRYNLELSHYLTLFRRGRIFAVRLLGEINTATTHDETPFFERASLGGSKNLRGYDKKRFRDKDLILLNLEYRYPIWDVAIDKYGGVDAVIFADIGRVFNDLREEIFKDYKLTYGVGIRARTTSGFLFRAEFAHSDEENKLVLKFKPMF